MSEASRSTDERAPETGEVETPGSRASGVAAREALVELGDRARAVVEELARHARERREAEPPAGRPADSSEESTHRPGRIPEDQDAALPQKLGELRACVGEVADVLEATIERLETVELQLGDPDASVERELAAGIARCERVLMGIELGIEHRGQTPEAPRPSAVRPAPTAPPRARVLVVSRSSRRRADLCVAVERQGLEAVAAHDLASALRATSRTSPHVALLDLEGTRAERVAVLEEWKDCQERGALPRAAQVAAPDVDPTQHGFEIIQQEHGDAAMAAVLVRLVRRIRGETDSDTD